MQTRNIPGRLSALFLLLALAAVPARAQSAAGAMERELIDQSLAAEGGLDRIRAIETKVIRAHSRLPAMGMNLPVTIYQKRPNKSLTEVDIQEMGGKVLNGYDGETAWSVNPMMGRRPQQLKGDQLVSTQENASLDGLFPFVLGRPDYRIVYAGEDSVRSRRVQNLRIIRPDSSEVLVSLDAETALMAKLQMEGVDPMSGAKAKMETYFSDYREVEGITMPFSMEVAINGQTFQVITIDDVKFNEAIDDTIFAMPAYDKN